MLNSLTKEEKTQLVLDVFRKLAQIPRPSTAEQAVGDYVEQTLRKAGLHVQREDCGNVIAEKMPASGYEDRPTVILQAHMDMVCVSDDTRDYDKYHDAIRLIEDEAYLRADGTSLGADDGIGVAVILAIMLDPSLKHGRLRAIFTVEEETSMRGACELDCRYLDGDYLINCDSEEVDTITVSSAGGMHIDATLACERMARRMESAVYRLTLSGLLGGHSGVDIHKGRANAILLMADMLSKITGVRLIRLDGGMARNAIPASVQAIVEIDEKQAGIMQDIIDTCQKEWQNQYPAESDITVTVELTDTEELPLSDDCLERLLAFCQGLPNGVHAMHKAIPALVETSSNLGIIQTTQETVLLRMHPRSSEKSALDWYRQTVRELARENRMEADCYGELPSWPLAQENRLAELAADVYARQNGTRMKIEACHAGLECSYFYQKNPHLTLISIGPTVEHVHSPQERIKIETIATHLDLIVGILEELQ